MGRRIVAAFLAAACIAVLSGCDTEMFQGPVSVKQAEGRLVIKVCAGGDITNIHASTWDTRTRSWVTFWQADVKLSLARGDEFLSGARDGVLFGEFTEPGLSAGMGIDISFTNANGAVASAVLEVPEQGLPTAEWLRSDGSIDSEACLDG